MESRSSSRSSSSLWSSSFSGPVKPGTWHPTLAPPLWSPPRGAAQASGHYGPKRRLSPGLQLMWSYMLIVEIPMLLIRNARWYDHLPDLQGEACLVPSSTLPISPQLEIASVIETLPSSFWHQSLPLWSLCDYLKRVSLCPGSLQPNKSIWCAVPISAWGSNLSLWLSTSSLDHCHNHPVI